jgi:hypothetical protein
VQALPRAWLGLSLLAPAAAVLKILLARPMNSVPFYGPQQRRPGGLVPPILS